MGETIIDLCETHIVDPDHVQLGVHSSQCPALADRGIQSVGYARITGRYHIVRLRPAFEHVTVCSRGEGQSLIGGRWVPFTAGAVVLSPLGAPHGARALPVTKGRRTPWNLVWVGFDPAVSGPRRIQVSEATLVQGNWEQLAVLVDGLAREQTQGRDAVAAFHWVELIHRFVERLLTERRGDARIARLWRNVQERLGEEWALPAMAHEAGLSEGHLRRLCRAALGAGPREELLRLRIERATLLLTATDASIAEIANAVGYSDAFAFSAAYRRETGRSPRAARKATRSIIV